MPTQAAPFAVVYSFNRYGTDYTVRWYGPGTWQFRRPLPGGQGSYFAENCHSIRDAVMDYFYGIDDDEASEIVASMSAAR